MGWIILIGGLLLLGVTIDFIAKKRNIQMDPEEGAKNASESERIYVESYLHNMKKNHENNPFL